MAKPRTQRELAQDLLKKQGIMRLLELREAGVTAATMSRMERAGEVIRLVREEGVRPALIIGMPALLASIA